jgi:PEGA domain
MIDRLWPQSASAWSLLLPALLACASTKPAGPAKPPESLGVAAVASPPGPGPELVELTAQLRAVVADRERGVIAPAEIRERMTGPPQNSSLAELERAFEGGLARYQNGDYDGAVRTLTGVADDLERLPDSSATFALWEKAMLPLARSHALLGQQSDEQRVLERLVTVSPDVKVDRTLFPPTFARRVEDVKAKLKGVPRRKLTVVATARAKVFVNGRDLGFTPVNTSLPAGRHRISAVSGSTRVPATYADLTLQDQDVTFDISLIECFKPAQGPGFALPDADRARRLVAAAAWLRLDRLLVTSVAQEGGATYFVGTLYDVRRGMLQREGRVRLGAQRTVDLNNLRALASFVLTGEPPPPSVEKVEQRVTPPAPPAAKPPAPQPTPPVYGPPPPPQKDKEGKPSV